MNYMLLYFNASSVVSTMLQKIDWSDLASICIAICALVFSIYQSRQNQNHNRLSVQPIFDFDRVLNGEEYYVLVTLSNVGFGPGRLIDTTWRWKDEKKSLDDLEIIIRQTKYSPKTKLLYLAGWKSSRKVIQSGESREMLRVTVFGDGSQKEKLSALALLEKYLVDNLTLELKYASIYDQEFTVTYDLN
jgi:hypothetical protein